MYEEAKVLETQHEKEASLYERKDIFKTQSKYLYMNIKWACLVLR